MQCTTRLRPRVLNRSEQKKTLVQRLVRARNRFLLTDKSRKIPAKAYLRENAVAAVT